MDIKPKKKLDPVYNELLAKLDARIREDSLPLAKRIQAEHHIQALQKLLWQAT